MSANGSSNEGSSPSVNAQFADALEKSGLTQEQLGAACGVSQARISQLCRTEGDGPSPELALAIESAIGFPAALWREADLAASAQAAEGRWAEHGVR